MLNLLDRYRGTFVGVHVGDALGAPYETWGPTDIALDITTRNGLHLFDYPNTRMDKPEEHILPAGMPTDDSEQTACLAMNLLACNGLETTHLFDLLRSSVIDEESVLWSGKSTGAGGTTRKALSGDPAQMAEAKSNTIGTNGSLMRASPMALWYFRELKAALDGTEKFASIRKDVFEMSAVTHNHQHSKSACWIYTCILTSLLAGEEVSQALYAIERIDRFWNSHRVYERMCSAIDDPNLIPYDPGAFPMRGTAEFSLYVALYALKHATSFAHGIEIAIRVGGDTDTYAAIAGGLLGAHYGYEAIPADWRKTILGHDVMVDLATKMYDRFVPST